MKILVSTPKEKIEKPKSKSRRTKRYMFRPFGKQTLKLVVIAYDLIMTY